MSDFVKRIFDRYRESTAKTISRRLIRNGVSIEQIRGEHIKSTYKDLKKRSSAPNFTSISEVLPNQVAKTINKSHPLWGVIVETREHPAIEFVINNFIETTGISIQLFHGKNNLDFIMSTSIARLVYEGKVYLTRLNVDKLNANDYNALFLSKKFWRNIIGRKKILIIQSDTVSCCSSDYVINDFILYDYIGSKWHRTRPMGIILDGGNGGLSLRDWKISYECLDRFPPEHWCGGEDGYFAFHIELMGGVVGKGNDCAKFGTQHEFLFNSFGAHQITCLNKKDKIAFLKYCPEAKFMLEKTNK